MKKALATHGMAQYHTIMVSGTGLHGIENTKTSKFQMRSTCLALKDAAADLFLSQGYVAVTLDAVIDRVGESRRNIYDHFGGKEGLFIEVISQLCEEIAPPLSEMKIDHKETKQALIDFGNDVLDLILQPRALDLHRLMIAEGHMACRASQRDCRPVRMDG